MKVVNESLAGLALGEPQVHLNLALFPLLDAGGGAGQAGYLLLDEALEQNLARVTEVSKEGSVPELAFENISPGPILLVDGDELIGAKQNRVLNLSILVGGGKKIGVPVSCVEQGRWAWRSQRFGTAKRALFAKARAKKYAHVSESLRQSGRRDADQNVLWQDVADKSAALDCVSATGAMGDVYEQRAGNLEDYCKAFRAQPRQRGAIAAIDGNVVGLELFDAAASFAKYLDKLVRSYALDALETADGRTVTPAAREAERFLKRLQAAAARSYASLGEGEDIRLTGKGIAGGALADKGRIVHLAGYAVAP